MKKPDPIFRMSYDYSECVRYIEEKYGVDLRNMAGKTWCGGCLPSDEFPYLDFWEWVMEHCEVANGKDIWLWEPADDQPEHVRRALGWFAEEFGLSVPYNVSW